MRNRCGELGADYEGKPLAIVAISSNDVKTHPADSPDGMRQQAHDNDFDFPYLYDEMQYVAHAYNAACTPDPYLFDADFKLVYRGQYDDSRPGNGIPVTGRICARRSMRCSQASRFPTEQKPSIGCNIKWKTA